MAPSLQRVLPKNRQADSTFSVCPTNRIFYGFVLISKDMTPCVRWGTRWPRLLIWTAWLRKVRALRMLFVKARSVPRVGLLF